jgi:hypothetical protein
MYYSSLFRACPCALVSCRWPPDHIVHISVSAQFASHSLIKDVTECISHGPSGKVTSLCLVAKHLSCLAPPSTYSALVMLSKKLGSRLDGVICTGVKGNTNVACMTRISSVYSNSVLVSLFAMAQFVRESHSSSFESGDPVVGTPAAPWNRHWQHPGHCLCT